MSILEPESALPYLDTETTAADPVSRVYALDASSPTGTPDTIGLVTKFAFHFPSPVILDFGEVDGVLLAGGDVRLEGAGASATARLIPFDVSPVPGFTWGSRTNFRSVRLTATLGTGTLGPASGGVPLTTNTLPLSGLLRLCVFLPADCDQYNYPLDFTKNGTEGVGIGGSRVLYNTTPISRFQISLQAAPWTIGTASVPGIPTPAGGEITSTFPPFRHGPASFTATASQPSGVIQLVSPTRIATDGLNIEPTPLYGVVRVRFVPEPGWLSLIGAGVVGLLLMGRARTKR